jgi:hypothetical protein
MQVAHKEGEKGNYLTVKDKQVRSWSHNVSYLYSEHRSLRRLLPYTLPAGLILNLSGLSSMSSCWRRDHISGLWRISDRNGTWPTDFHFKVPCKLTARDQVTRVRQSLFRCGLISRWWDEAGNPACHQ